MPGETEAITFLSGNLKLVGTLAYPLPRNQYYGVLFIHGGGRYSESKYPRWQAYLSQQGYSSLAYFCRGMGKSEGQFEEATLNNRLQDAQAALAFFRKSGVVDPRGIAVVGSSMGAHVAVRLAQSDARIKTLLLQSAAAYGPQAEDKLLNEQFTEVISAPDSWQDSPIWDALRKFKGHLGIAYGEKDEVIPLAIQKRYQACIKKGAQLIIPKGQHRLLVPENEAQREAEQDLYRFSVEFLNKNLT